MASLLVLPKEIIFHIIRFLSSTEDLLSFSLTSRAMRRKCSMRATELQNTLDHLCLEKIRNHKKGPEIGIVETEKRIFTLVPRNIPSGASRLRLALIKSIWLYYTQQGSIPTKAIQPGVRLAESYSSVGRMNDAITVLESIWKHWTQESVSKYAMDAGVMLSIYYDSEGRKDDAMAILNRIYLFDPGNDIST